MRRLLVVTLLVISMLTMVGFTSVEAGYWEDMMEIYDWKAMEGQSEADLDISFPQMDLDYQFKIITNSQSSMEDLIAYSKITVEDLQGDLNIPVIEMYVDGSDLYINKEAVLALLSAVGMEGVLDIEEEYIMLENGQGDLDMDFNNIINDSLKLLEDMDLGIDLNMEKEGDTYSLSLESDDLIDLVEGYFRYFVENVDNLPASLTQGQEIQITEEEKQEALEEFNNFISQYKEMVKALIAGSSFNMESTFGQDNYKENSQLIIKTPMGSATINTEAVTSKLEEIAFDLPGSVKKITAEELEELIKNQVASKGPKLLLGLDGSYVKLNQLDFEEGKIEIEVVDGKSYITVEDASKLLDVDLEGLADSFHIRELDEYGFRVEWNEAGRLIEIY